MSKLSYARTKKNENENHFRRKGMVLVTDINKTYCCPLLE